MSIIHVSPYALFWFVSVWVFSNTLAAVGQPPADEHETPPRYVAPGGSKGGDISAAGDLVLAVDDLDRGLVSRTYGSQLCGGRGPCAGYGWHLNGLPHLIDHAGQIIVFFGPRLAYWYTASDDAYTPRFGARQTLTHDAENHLFIFFERDGTVYEFYDFEGRRAGQFRKRTRPGGNTFEVTKWTPRGKIKEIQLKISKKAAAYKLWEHDYVTGGANDGRLKSIVVRGRTDPSQLWTDSKTRICRVTYNYYVTEASEPNGLTGDLKTAVRQFWNRDAWVGDDTHYYRYYIDPPRKHLLKMALSRQGYADAKAVYPDLTSSNVNDEKLLHFSSRYLAYNSHRQVIRAVFNGRVERQYKYHARNSARSKKEIGNR